MLQKPIEEQSPFLAAVISGLLAAAITWSLLENFKFLLLFLPLSIAFIIFLKFHLLSFLAGLLTDLVIASIGHRNISTLTMIAIFIGIVWETGTAIVNGSLKNENILERSTPIQNSIFAGFGVIINLVLLTKLCQNYDVLFSSNNVGDSFLKFVDCVLKFFMSPIARTETTFLEMQGNIFSIITNPENLNSDYIEMFATGKISWEGIVPILKALGKTFLLAPPTWAAFFAALRQTGFRFWNLPILFRQTWKAYFYGQTAIGAGIILLLLLIPISLLPQEFRGVGYFSWISLSYFIFILRVGQGAQNGL